MNIDLSQYNFFHSEWLPSAIAKIEINEPITFDCSYRAFKPTYQIDGGKLKLIKLQYDLSNQQHNNAALKYSFPLVCNWVNGEFGLGYGAPSPRIGFCSYEKCKIITLENGVVVNLRENTAENNLFKMLQTQSKVTNELSNQYKLQLLEVIGLIKRQNNLIDQLLVGKNIGHRNTDLALVILKQMVDVFGQNSSVIELLLSDSNVLNDLERCFYSYIVGDLDVEPFKTSAIAFRID